jgi:hypothetical protein
MVAWGQLCDYGPSRVQSFGQIQIQPCSSVPSSSSRLDALRLRGADPRRRTNSLQRELGHPRARLGRGLVRYLRHRRFAREGEGARRPDVFLSYCPLRIVQFVSAASGWSSLSSSMKASQRRGLIAVISVPRLLRNSRTRRGWRHIAFDASIAQTRLGDWS